MHVAQFCIVFAIILLLFTVEKSWQIHEFSKELDKLKIELTQSKSYYDYIKAKYPEIATDAEMQAQIDQIKKEIADRREVRIKSIYGETRTGFSIYMESLAKAIVPGAWITSFNVANDGETVRITGAASSPSAVTQFIQNLKHQPGFINREFKTIKVLEPKKPDNRFHFILNSVEEFSQEVPLRS